MKLLYDFKNKLFLTYAVIFLLLTLLSVIGFYAYTSSSIQKNSNNLFAQTSEKIVYKLDNIISSMDTTALQIISNQELQTILLNASQYDSGDNYFDYNDRLKTSNILSSINGPLMTNARISIFDINYNHISVGSLSTQNKAFVDNFEKKYNILFEKNLSTSQTIIFPPQQDNWTTRNPTIVFSLLRKIPYINGTNRILGYVEIGQSYKMLEDAVSVATDNSFDVIIVDESGCIVYPYQKLSEEQTQYYLQVADESPFRSTRPWDSKEEFIHTQHSSVSGWTVILAQEKNDYHATLLRFQTLLLSYAIIFFFIFLLLLFWITKKMTAPITQLRKSVETLSLVEPSIHIDTSTTNNEINMLTEAFNHTISRLNESMEQILAANKNQAQAHILAMQAQMNPHFLFNTLMGISGIAAEYDNMKIVEICDRLASMLRYISSFKDSQVPLREEIKYTKNYLDLMKIRYENFLDYSLDTLNEAENIPVAKLILQPIVENCFSHGFKNISPPYKIRIAVELSEKLLILSITDNGVGFPPDFIQKFKKEILHYQSLNDIKEYINNSEIGGLGLISIFLRLRLLYGADTEIKLQNNAEGCSVFLLIPANHKETRRE